jgi:hypothetical protein
MIGWREWIGLPGLGISCLKAKIDSGARTSALHAFAVEVFEEAGQKKVRFKIHPRQRISAEVIDCVADLEDIRWVIDSGGHREKRCVIKTPIVVGTMHWPIEITLTNRDDMRFKMLLGRTAMSGRLIVNPEVSFLLGKKYLLQGAIPK